MPKKYDKDEPILLIIRRGRKGRGFTVSPVEDISNPAACLTAEELGETIEEMLNDESQPRVNIKDLMAAADGDPPEADEPEGEGDDEEEEGDYDEDEDEEDEGIMSGVADAQDPVDKFLFNVFARVVKKGQGMSSKARKPRARKRRRAKKPSKK
jgi:hypothetical protein